MQAGSASQGRRDRLSAGMAQALTAAPYLAFANNSVNHIDALGLLLWEKQECQGCNAGGFPEWLGYVHWPTETDTSCGWVSGASGSFSHGCSLWPLWSSVLCDTETHVFIRVKNDECCEKWQVTCAWAYAAELEASLYVSINLSLQFLGSTPSPYPILARDPATGVGPSGSYKAWATILDSRSQVVTIPRGATIAVLNMQPRNTLAGNPNVLVEVGAAACTATCVE